MEAFDSQYMPHQRDALSSIQKEYAQAEPVISFQLCTGSGKTRVIIRLPSLLSLKKNVFVFPTLALIDQFKQQYLDNFQFFLYKEVSTNGISDEELLLELENPEFCLITTYASLPMILENSVEIDALIFDEAHHVDGPKCYEAIKNNLHKIKTQFRASATLNDDESPCYTYSFSDAVRDGRCRDYGIYCFIRKAGDENQFISYLLDHQRLTGNGKVMAFTRWSSADRDDGSQSVNRFYDRYVDQVKSCGGWIEKIVAGTKNRDSILKEFDSQPDDRLCILVSCKTISEGIDTKNANVAYFVDADKNNIAIIQRIGRATRPYRGENGMILEEQRPGSVLVGMYISPEKYEGKSKQEIDSTLKQEMSEDGDFGPIFRVLSALRQTDEEMYERCIRYPHFDRIARKVEEKGYDLIEGGVEEVYGEYEDLEDLASENGICVVEHVGDCQVEHGEGKEEVHVLRDDDSEVYLMADKKQRYSDEIEKKRKRKPALMLDLDPSFKLLFGIDENTNLAEDVIAKINIEIEEDGKTGEDRQVEKARELVVWVRANGKTPSNGSKEAVEKKLAKWLSRKKADKKAGKLYPSVNDILVEGLGEGWWEDREAQAIAQARELVAWVRANGKTPAESSKNNIEKKLGQWLSNKKTDKKAEKLYPSVENILIEELGEGWWEDNREEQAIDQARELIAWVRKNGKTPSMSSKNNIEKKLGQWLSHRKADKKAGKLYPSVNDILVEELGDGWWEDNREAQAIAQARELIAWVRKNGKTPSTIAKNNIEKKLGQWLSNKKTDKKAGKLYPSVENILIEELGDGWHLPGCKYIPQSNPVQTSHSSTCSVQSDGNSCTCRISTEKEKSLSYRPQQSPPKSAQPASSPKPLPLLSQLHKEYKTLHSRNLHARFQENKEKWVEYHRLSEDNERGFGEDVPYKRVVNYIKDQYKTKKSRVIIDLGCGMARVSREFKNRANLTFINIDHIACDDTVQQGDISQTRLEDGEADLAILCLAMWGSNCEEYLEEAHRILDTQGRLVVIEPSKRWDDGKRLREMLLKNNFVVTKEEVELPNGTIHKFCMFVVSKR